MNLALTTQTSQPVLSADELTSPEFLALNKDQQQAANEIFGLIFSNAREHTISGPAGTGKTHLMGYIRNNTLREYSDACRLLGVNPVKYKVALTATTNKATEVLAMATGQAALTIYSFLGLKVNDDYDTGKTIIEKTERFGQIRDTLIFVDEASMVNQELYTFIQQAIGPNTKVIYLGDHCQLAPVGEELSPVFRNPTRISYLNQPMRNAGQPALMALCSQLRATVETGKFHPIIPVPGVIDYVSPDQAYAFMVNRFAANDPNVRCLAFSNARVQEYNAHIRGIRALPLAVTAGEILVNNTAFHIGGTPRSPKIIPIEREIMITSVTPKLHTLRPYSPDQSLTWQGYEINFMPRASTADVEAVERTAMMPANRDAIRSLMKIMAARSKAARDWRDFFEFKNRIPDFRARDASTVYKAQGSTYDEVFIDLANLSTCWNPDQLARMLYVAVSRAKSRVILFGTLPQRLFT